MRLLPNISASIRKPAIVMSSEHELRHAVSQHQRKASWYIVLTGGTDGTIYMHTKPDLQVSVLVEQAQ